MAFRHRYCAVRNNPCLNPKVSLRSEIFFFLISNDTLHLAPRVFSMEKAINPGYTLQYIQVYKLNGGFMRVRSDVFRPPKVKYKYIYDIEINNEM